MKLKHCPSCGWLEDYEIQEPCEDCPKCDTKTILVQPYGIWCVRLPSSSLGYDEAWMKQGGSVIYYASKEKAIEIVETLNLNKGTAKVYYRVKAFPAG
jgi:hypothetical protein